MNGEDIQVLMESLKKNWLDFKDVEKVNVKQLSKEVDIPVTTMWCHFQGQRKWTLLPFLKSALYFGALRVDLKKCALTIKFPVTEQNRRILKRFGVTKK